MNSSNSKSGAITLKRAAFYALTLMAAHGITPSMCFGPDPSVLAFRTSSFPATTSAAGTASYTTATSSSATSSTRRFFRATSTVDAYSYTYRAKSDGNINIFANTNAPSTSTGSSSSSNTGNSNGKKIFAVAPNERAHELTLGDAVVPTIISGMPTWLASSRSHLVQKNIDALRKAMRESFFTENEFAKLNYAIQEAANGDANKLAGAAEFCLMLIETMEMGLNPLIAAAFHFCACVAAREQSLLLRYQGSPTLQSSAWELRQHPVVASSFGEHVSEIERDLARLKRLEVVASMVIQNSGVQGRRVFPDANDASNLRKLYLTESKDWRSLAIRSAACLYRLRGISQAGGDRKLTREAVRVSREALHIYAPLASRLGMHRLKNELEGAAFRILYRRQYETVSMCLRRSPGIGSESNEGEIRSAFGHRRKRSVDDDCYSSGEDYLENRMKQVLETVQAELTEMLKNDPVFSSSVTDFTVTARVKEAYSAWVKMLKIRAKDILDVPDAIALRIVFNGKKNQQDEPNSVTEARERALCYYAQKLCTERWLPLKGNPRFKDYIEKPKPNGYQSLHYTASTTWDGEDWNIEIQVRSGKMHQVAEIGLASHWDYKARSRSSLKSDRDDLPKTVTISDPYSGKDVIGSSGAYLQSLQEWHWRQQGNVRQEESAKPTLPKPLFSPDFAESQIRAARIRARTQHLAPYIEALAETQSDLSREHVFVFLTGSADANDGKILSLPAGAMVIDAIREYQHVSGIRNISLDETVTVNGMPAALFSALRNGDILSVPSLMAMAA